MSFSIVLFDLDGTLIDTCQLIVTSFQFTLKEKLGLEVSPEQIYPYFGEPLATTMARYAPDRTEELVDCYRRFNLEHHDALIRQFDGVSEAVEQLKGAGVKLGVVTSKRRDLAHRGLRLSRLDHLFDVVVTVDDTDRHKPDPAPVLLALQLLGELPGSRVLMVGDSPLDIRCGRNAGVKTAAVGWSVLNPCVLEAAGPDYWVAKPADLVALVFDTAG